jgi:hypothetical protein
MPVSVVILKEPNMLRGSSCSEHGLLGFLPSWVTNTVGVKGGPADLTYRVFPTEQDKSKSLPARGRYIARCFDGGADSIKGKSEGRSVMERISVEFSQEQHHRTRKRAHFPYGASHEIAWRIDH